MGSLKILVLVYIKAIHVSHILKSKTGYLASSVYPVECVHETPVRTLPEFCDPYGDHAFEGDLLRNTIQLGNDFTLLPKSNKAFFVSLKRVLH